MNSSVKDVMTRCVIGVRETAWFKDILAAMRPYGVSAFPVLDSAHRVIGVVSEADLLLKEIGPELTLNRGERVKAAGVTAAQLMSTPAITISPDASVAEAAKIMYTRRVKRLPVVEDDGRLVGIISRVDVLSVFDRQDNQICNDVWELITEEFALDPNVFETQAAHGAAGTSPASSRSSPATCSPSRRMGPPGLPHPYRLWHLRAQHTAIDPGQQRRSLNYAALLRNWPSATLDSPALPGGFRQLSDEAPSRLSK